MKKYKIYIPLVTLVFLTPLITFASWWNPISWNWKALFTKQSQSENSGVNASVPVKDQATIKKECDTQAQTAYDTYTTNSGLTNELSLGAKNDIADVQSYEDKLKTDRDSREAEIRSQYDSLISQAQTTQASQTAQLRGLLIQTGANHGDGYDGALSAQQTYNNQTITSLQNTENSQIAQVESLYQETYQKYEAVRQKIMDRDAKAKQDIKDKANSLKSDAYQKCVDNQ